MSKRNMQTQVQTQVQAQTQTQTPSRQDLSCAVDEWFSSQQEGKTLEELLAAAAAAKAAAEKATKIAEEATKAAEKAAKAAEAEAEKAKEAAAAERAKVIAKAKAAGKYRMAYLPVMTDGTLGRPYASPFLAEQASPMGKIEKRLCWGAITGPIGDPLTPEEMEDIQ